MTYYSTFGIDMTMRRPITKKSFWSDHCVIAARKKSSKTPQKLKEKPIKMRFLIIDY